MCGHLPNLPGSVGAVMLRTSMGHGGCTAGRCCNSLRGAEGAGAPWGLGDSLGGITSAHVSLLLLQQYHLSIPKAPQVFITLEQVCAAFLY